MRRGERPRFANVTLGGDPPRPRQTPSRDRHVGSSRTSYGQRPSEVSRKPRWCVPSALSPFPRRRVPRRSPWRGSTTPAESRPRADERDERDRDRPPGPASRRSGGGLTRDSVSADPRRCPVASLPPRVADRASPAHPPPREYLPHAAMSPSSFRAPSYLLATDRARFRGRDTTPNASNRLYSHEPGSSSSSRAHSPSPRATSAWPSGWSSPRVCRRPSGARSSSAPATPTRRSSPARSA